MPANTFSSQRILSAQELTRMGEAIAGNYHFPAAAGGAVTPSSGMVLAVAAIVGGQAVVNGTRDYAGYAGGTVTVSTAHASLPRRDYVYFEPGVGCGVTAGTAATKPSLPTLASGRIAIAEVYVAANDTTIGSSEIIDRRQAVLPQDARSKFLLATPRRKYGEFTAGGAQVEADAGVSQVLLNPQLGMGPYSDTNQTPGTSNVSAMATDGGIILTTTTTSGQSAGIVSTGTSVNALSMRIAPDKSPMMLISVTPPAANAAMSVWLAGFFDAQSTTPNGAFLRRTTTGNVEFVTRQGTETTTGLGASTTWTNVIIESVDAGVTWRLIDADSGAVLASHTGTAPTVTADLAFGTIVENNTTTAVLLTVRYILVEGDC